MTLASDLHNLTHLAATLRVRGIRADTTLRREMGEHDGYPSRGDGVGRSNDTSSTVERAVINGHASLLTLTTDRAKLHGLVRDALEAVNAAITVADRYAPAPPKASDLRCTGGFGMPGHLEWGDPDCEKVQESGRSLGLCLACRKRRERAGYGKADAA